jgi:hypothetical protein
VRTHLKLSTTTPGTLSYAGDKKRLIKYFVCWKHAEVVADLECEIANHDTKIRNREVARSTYTAHKSRGVEALVTPFEYALWEKIASYDRSISGGYFDAIGIDPEGGVDVPEYEIIIRQTYFLEFQSWELYPQFLLGEVVVKIKASMRGGTIGQVRIATTIAEHEPTYSEMVPDGYFGSVSIKELAIGQTHDSTQIHNPFNGIVCIDAARTARRVASRVATQSGNRLRLRVLPSLLPLQSLHSGRARQCQRACVLCPFALHRSCSPPFVPAFRLGRTQWVSPVQWARRALTVPREVSRSCDLAARAPPGDTSRASNRNMISGMTKPK